MLKFLKRFPFTLVSILVEIITIAPLYTIIANQASIYYLAYPNLRIFIIIFTILILAAYLFLLFFAWKRDKIRNLNELVGIYKSTKKLKPSDFILPGYRKSYVLRDSDKKLEEELKNNHCALLIGVGKIGKTRTVYELIKKMKDYYVLKPSYNKPKTEDIPKINLPIFSNKVVLILDDLDKIVDKFEVDSLVAKLEEESNFSKQRENLKILGICRVESFEEVLERDKKERFMENLLTRLKGHRVEIENLKPEQEKELIQKIKEDDPDFNSTDILCDGTPGAIVLKTRSRIETFKGLPGPSKKVMYALKFLRLAGIYFPSEELVKQVVKRIFNLDGDIT